MYLLAIRVTPRKTAALLWLWMPLGASTRLQITSKCSCRPRGPRIEHQGCVNICLSLQPANIQAIWLVVGPPLWKIWKSIGMMTFPIYGKIKLMFQTTNQQFLGSPNPPNPFKPILKTIQNQFPSPKSRYHRGSSLCRGHRAPHSARQEAVHNRWPFPPASWPGFQPGRDFISLSLISLHHNYNVDLSEMLSINVQ